MMRIIAFYLLIASTMVKMANASQFDVSTIFSHLSWSVTHTYNSVNERTFCAADTENSVGQIFSIVVYDSGGAAVFVIDPRWKLSLRSVKFRVDVDYDIWRIDGTAKDIAVSANLSGDRDAAKFVGQLMEGSAVAIYNETDERLATFSLRGSSAAIQKLDECWSRLNRPDPFVTVSDPF